MSAPYALTIITGTSTISATASQLTPPDRDTYGEIIEVFVSSASAFMWSSESAGTYLTAGLNPATSRYERTFSCARAFGQLWFKAAGSLAVLWEARLSRNAFATL